jgi:hypothetical protein
MRIKKLRQKFLALAAAISIPLGFAAIVAPAASASDAAPCGGDYCSVYNSEYGYLYDSDNILYAGSSITPFAFLNERTWDGRDVYEMYERTTAKCITWAGTEPENIFTLTGCTPGSADQEFFYNADQYLISVGATSDFGPFSCMIAAVAPTAHVCSQEPTDLEVWTL